MESPGNSFLTTRWSLVLEASSEDDSARQRSLEYLCQMYWYPLYAYVRRRGVSKEDAEDLTQAFFERFLEKQDIETADPAKGKFRAFLLVCLKHFLSNEWDKARAEKRGGKVKIISFDAVLAETRFQKNPVLEAAPDEVFDHGWALTLVEQTMTRLETEFRRKGQSATWQQLRGTLSMSREDLDYQALARSLDMTPGAVKTAVHRLRKRYREELRTQVADTVTPEDVDDEMRYLLSVLSQ